MGELAATASLAAATCTPTPPSNQVASYAKALRAYPVDFTLASVGGPSSQPSECEA